MIISYDKNPALTTDQKLESLIESIQLALNEKADNALVIALEKKLKEITDN